MVLHLFREKPRSEARLEREVAENRLALTKRLYHNLLMVELPRPPSSIEADRSIWAGFNGFGGGQIRRLKVTVLHAVTVLMVAGVLMQ
jgi:hypothetical protein